MNLRQPFRKRQMLYTIASALIELPNNLDKRFGLTPITWVHGEEHYKTLM
jgi:hypothetical protein